MLSQNIYQRPILHNYNKKLLKLRIQYLSLPDGSTVWQLRARKQFPVNWRLASPTNMAAFSGCMAALYAGLGLLRRVTSFLRHFVEVSK